jgi:hypothetical protein
MDCQGKFSAMPAVEEREDDVLWETVLSSYKLRWPLLVLA